MKTIIKRFSVLIFWACCSPIFAQNQYCESGILSPEVSEFLKMVPTDNRSLNELRKGMNIEEYKRTGPPPLPYPKNDVKSIKLTADSIPVLVFNSSNANKLPIIIALHGGGFITPLLKGHEYSYWKDAQKFNAVVFAVDYRVAPEFKFPVGANDCYNVFKWISEHGSQYGGDTTKIIIKGESAGANLTAVLCQKAKQDGIAEKIKLQILNSPVVDSPDNIKKYQSMDKYANGLLLTKAGTLFALETYADAINYNDSDFAPILFDDLSSLPPAVIITAEFDPLRDQGLAYAQRLVEANVKVWNKCFPGQIHALVASNETTLNKVDELILSAMKEVIK